MKTDKNNRTQTTSGTLLQPDEPAVSCYNQQPDSNRLRYSLGIVARPELKNIPTQRVRILHGDCIEQLRQLRSASVDFILTDPPYLVNYKDRAGRSIQNDDNDRWLFPAFAELYRVLKPNACCASFYGWNKAEVFLSAWKRCGFKPIGHFVWVKNYASCVRYSQVKHEQAYLLAKGNPPLPNHPLASVLSWQYTGNKLHPTQKPVSSLVPLVEAYSPLNGIVLDPFAGSGSTGVAALVAHRRSILIEKDAAHYQTIRDRFEKLPYHLTTSLVRDIPIRRKILFNHVAASVKK